MNFDAAEAAIETRWESDPLLRACFLDLQTFRQVELLRTQTAANGMLDVAANLAERRAEVADAMATRLATFRDPAIADRRHSIADRFGARLQLWLWGPIDNGLCKSGVQSEAVLDALARNSDAEVVVVRIASTGGVVSTARTIADALQRHRGRTIAVVDRDALSAAALIACACDQVWIRSNALLMFHRTIGFASGNAAELRERALELDRDDKELLRSIAKNRHLKVGSYEIANCIQEGRYLTATDALRLGVADRIIHPLPSESATAGETP